MAEEPTQENAGAMALIWANVPNEVNEARFPAARIGVCSAGPTARPCRCGSRTRCGAPGEREVVVIVRVDEDFGVELRNADDGGGSNLQRKSED